MNNAFPILYGRAFFFLEVENQQLHTFQTRNSHTLL